MTMTKTRTFPSLLALALASACAHRAPPPSVTAPAAAATVPRPLLRAVDLEVGESATLELADGRKVRVELLRLDEQKDDLRGAVRAARVEVRVGGETVTLTSATYHLPVTVAAAGVQIDCPITRGHAEKASRNVWGLDRAARLRLWPAGSPWFGPERMVYPARQRWFAGATHMANEPVFVDGGDVPDPAKKVYYHWGLDLGGSEGLVGVVAATDGLVVSRGVERLAGHEQAPIAPRYDVVYLQDRLGWYYRYSHLKTIDPAVELGGRVSAGQAIGLLGKEGGSGGWSHLHFDVTSLQPSGKWGIQEGYAFLFEAYRRERAPRLLAVARPHHFVWTGQPVTLDGSRSWSASGAIAHHAWRFGDGTTAEGARVSRTYERAGTYSEVLQVTDADGRVDHDFAVVQVVDRADPKTLPPSINANYAPTLGLRPGDPITFRVRSFRTSHGEETWDFGDGSPPVTVRSDGNAKPLAPEGYATTVHRYARPGHYVVRVEHTAKSGLKAVAHLQVRVGVGE